MHKPDTEHVEVGHLDLLQQPADPEGEQERPLRKPPCIYTTPDTPQETEAGQQPTPAALNTQKKKIKEAQNSHSSASAPKNMPPSGAIQLGPVPYYLSPQIQVSCRITIFVLGEDRSG